jgi:uncharacterized protein YdeI (YjbR/CyaY-like superfamily)
MARTLISLDVRNRREWRRWLAAHHASSPGVWLVFHKRITDKKALTYEDAVREALCFGWIDSLVKRLDAHRYARKFTPRRATSKWSDINRKRWGELNALGLLAAPGRAAAPSENRYAPKPRIPELPSYIAKAVKLNPEAWAFFQRLALTYRRDYVVWIHTAKRAETRAARLAETIRLLASKRKLGLR